jgi:hypothetical protein
MPRQRLFIVSLPRSGSTVLTAMLDRYDDILCLPESHFPAYLESIGHSDWQDPERLAACFVACCTDGSPLTFDEARACMSGDRQETLEAIAKAVARKCGRDYERIKVVVWKSTRMAGTFPSFTRPGEKHLVLRRNPLNVFESQFRVPFGKLNQSPARFALFEASYEAAFGRLPPDSTLQIEYAAIPDSIKKVVLWCGSDGEAGRKANSGLVEISGRMPWHTEINKPFNNTDPDKLRNLKTLHVWSYHLTHAMLALLPLVGRLARKLANRREFNAIRQRADEALASTL